MRRNDKAITERAAMLSIIRRAQVCRLAMCAGEQPYVVSLCFGLLGDCLYFHCASAGRKLDTLRANPRVCVEFAIDQEVVFAPVSCKMSMRYRSVIGFGTAAIVENAEEKRRGMEAIVRQYAEMTDTIPDAALARIVVLKVSIEELTGKSSGYTLTE
jgi:nitroimidazol reductase NimA-like FMN-containing flavoprotein (pyridoxamine 5'-phosphate oxidase superfamily)